VLPKKKKDSGGRGRKIEGSRPGGWKHGSCGRVDPVIKPYYCQKKRNFKANLGYIETLSQKKIMENGA
jgi:hypothetical protein